MELRAKTLIKLQNDTVRLDLEIQKGVTLVGTVRSLINFTSSVEELDRIDTYLKMRREQLIVNAAEDKP